MRVARFPHHKDFATFDYGISAVKKPEVEQLCTGQFTTDAHNLILVGGTGTGKTHIAIALGAALINQGKKARFHNAVDPLAGRASSGCPRSSSMPSLKNRPREMLAKSSGNLPRWTV